MLAASPCLESAYMQVPQTRFRLHVVEHVCITAQILDSCRVPITIRSEDKFYNGLFLMWREQLLLNRLVLSCLSSVTAMPLSGRGNRRCCRFAPALCSRLMRLS
jgi:hypothetical protein